MEDYNDLPKNEFFDSFVIADCLRFGRINKAVHLDDYRYIARKTFTRSRFYIVRNLVRGKQRLINVILKKHSSLTLDKVFSNKFGKSTLSVFTDFDSANTLATMDLNKLTKLIKKKGERFDKPNSFAKAL